MSVKNAGGIARSSGASGLRNGVFTGASIRPTGYSYPTGLSIAGNSPISVEYLLVAGGFENVGILTLFFDTSAFSALFFSSTAFLT
jgi:hypothetical protein